MTQPDQAHFLSAEAEENTAYIQINHHTSTDWSMDQHHFHDFYELNLSISGGNRFFINDQVHYADKGDLFFINAYDLHKNIIPKEMHYERYIINFNPKAVDSFSKEENDLLELFTISRDAFNNKLSLTQDELLDFKTLLDDTIYHSKSDYYNNKLYLQIKLAEILLMIHKFYHKDDLPQNSTVQNTFQKTKAILDYINHHLDDTLTLDFLSKHFYINKTYLCDKFKSDTGFTVNQYITSKRILKAKELLTKGHNVTETAKSVGYENDSHFIRTFKKAVGTTPKQYSKRHN